MTSPDLFELLSALPGGSIVLELTEHAVVEDYTAVRMAVDRLRGMGLRLATDDVGAGYASLRHILELRPDFIKLDAAITRGVAHDPVHQAMAVALVQFCRDANTTLIAEGIETSGDLFALRRLGVTTGQSLYFARPAPPGAPPQLRQGLPMTVTNFRSA